MIFVGDQFDFQFRTKTKDSIRCALGKQFYILLFSNNSAIHENTAHHVCFVIPIHYPSLIRSISKDTSMADSTDKLFRFNNAEDKKRLSDYVRNLPNHDFEIIKELEFIRKKQ